VNEDYKTLQTSTTRASELEKIVIGIMRSMSLDYPADWAKSYPNQIDKKQLKQRLMKLLSEFSSEAIVEGYENCIKERPGFMPRIPEITASVSAAQKQIDRQQRNQTEAALLAPKKAASNQMPMNIREAWNEALRNAKGTPEGLREARERHEKIIADAERKGLIKRTSYNQGSLCCRCNKPGVLSHSTMGDGNWYCSDHFNKSL